MLQELADDAGRFRRGGVGIYRGQELIHMAPPADRVPALVSNLLKWSKKPDLHPLLVAAVVHYEIEFIHPFSDGNGRMGRLWQTLILSQWKSIFAWLPLETVVRDQQSEYYAALARSDKTGEAGSFVEFILSALLTALSTDQVSDQVKSLILALKKAETPLSTTELMKWLKLRHRPTFRRNYLRPALDAGLIEMTDPGSPSSPQQRYRLLNP